MALAAFVETNELRSDSRAKVCAALGVANVAEAVSGEEFAGIAEVAKTGEFTSRSPAGFGACAAEAGVGEVARAICGGGGDVVDVAALSKLDGLVFTKMK